ncbi:MAG: TIGR03620 family F420-dependent LLM class oxidoreductase [Aeromicrobium sp.]
MSPPLALSDRLGPLGLWTSAFDAMAPGDIPGVMDAVESQGWGTLWFAESRVGREAMSLASLLLSHTERMVIATGVANLWFRDPWAAAKGQAFLTEASGDRFILGLGVGHRGVTPRSKSEYGRPVDTLSDYVAAVDRIHRDEAQAFAGRRVLAALGPRMLALSASTSAGAISYLGPVSHTRSARASLGPEPFLAVSLKVALGRKAEVLEVARASVAGPLQLRNYTANLVRLGHGEADVLAAADGVVHDLVAMGTVDDVASRVQAHLDVGADHVALEVVADRTEDVLAAWAELSTMRITRVSRDRGAGIDGQRCPGDIA